MPRGATPTVRRRQLGARLREIRLGAGLTVDEVADRLMVSAAKVSRLETASRGASLRDVRDLSRIYELSSAETERLMELARESHKKTWWQRYDLPYSTFVGLEAAAATISIFRSSSVPGLLQTESYALALASGDPDATEDGVRGQVEARLLRQEILRNEAPPKLHVILDEGALHRAVGGAETMAKQVAALMESAALPHVTIQVLPYAAGAHPGMDSNFTLLHFDEAVGGDLGDVVYVEGLLGQHYLEAPADVERYRAVFDRLRGVALPARESRRRLRQIADAHHADS